MTTEVPEDQADPLAIARRGLVLMHELAVEIGEAFRSGAAVEVLASTDRWRAHSDGLAAATATAVQVSVAESLASIAESLAGIRGELARATPGAVRVPEYREYTRPTGGGGD